jgi:hypothetical protein
LEKEKVLLEKNRDKEKLKLEREKIHMSERDQRSNVLIVLVKAGK